MKSAAIHRRHGAEAYVEALSRLRWKHFVVRAEQLRQKMWEDPGESYLHSIYLSKYICIYYDILYIIYYIIYIVYYMF